MGRVADALRLRADDLLSKWGFWDGDIPHSVWDAWNARYGDVWSAPIIDAWEEVLARLVKERLLPVIEQDVEWYEIGSHNPIRARRIDGVEVDDLALSRERTITLTPEFVDIPMDEVLDLLLEAA